jgi:hypothetical protein
MGLSTVRRPRAVTLSGFTGVTGFVLGALAAACGGSERAVEPELAPLAPISTASAALEAPPELRQPSPLQPSAALPDFSVAGWNQVDSRAGTYRVHWRSLAGKIPRNEDFELEVWVLRDGAPAKDVHLDVHAWMPDHGHGMLRKTRPEPQPDGSFRVQGMLLHMRGHWQLFFDMLEGTVAETAESAVDL